MLRRARCLHQDGVCLGSGLRVGELGCGTTQTGSQPLVNPPEVAIVAVGRMQVRDVGYWTGGRP